MSKHSNIRGERSSNENLWRERRRKKERPGQSPQGGSVSGDKRAEPSPAGSASPGSRPWGRQAVTEDRPREDARGVVRAPSKLG